MSILKYRFFKLFRRRANQFELFSAGHAPAENTPTQPPWAASTSAHTGEGESKGGTFVPSLNNYTSLAVFIFTPGPMVEAATQLRIY